MTAGLLDRSLRRLVRLTGWRSRETATSVGPMHVLEREGEGDLPPVVFVHGLGSAGVHFVPMMRHLRPHVRRVLAVDLPGHGFSVRPAELTLDVVRAGLMEALDGTLATLGEPVVLVGNSLGGAATVKYAAERPDGVAGTVLFAPAGAPMNDEELATLQAIFGIRTHAAAVTFLHRLLARPPSALRAHLIAPGIRRTFTDPRLQGWLSSIGHADFLTPDEVRALPPTRLVWGGHERILPNAALAFWRQHLPAHATVREVAAVGHSPHLDDARDAAGHVLEHLRSLRDLSAAAAARP